MTLYRTFGCRLGAMLEITKKFIQDLQADIHAGKDAEISAKVADLHPADLAEIFDEVKHDEAVYIYKLLHKDLAADMLVELEEDVREKLLGSLTSREIAQEIIDRIDSDDAADMISELPEEKIEEIISHIDDEEQASDLIDLLNYEEGTAGALMAKELVKVNQNWNVAQCIREMRLQAEDIENVYTIYVVDDQDTLLGKLSLKKLLFSSTSTRSLIRDIYNPKELKTVGVEDDADTVVTTMEKYDLAAVPVVNDANQLLGRITFDDAMDVLREESDRDYQLASGISEDVESDDSIWELTRARLPWLLIGMAGGISGAYVIGAFDIEKNPGMALFIPLIAAMGGNVGVQSAAIVVQGLANKSIKTNEIAKRLGKELGVGVLNGLICAVIILLASYILNFGLALSLTVSIALLAVIIFAALFGTFIPLVLDRYKIDPALATGPFITTANDIIGLIIYFLVGNIISGIF
ncbi:magnesium transporter [Sanyastnella coralliicola]|uniref:magnesium transporter n=1 Tax=Sanyastnella coralliicola TaxID=3069118 RepID=UPI0027B93B95|nr:magnesium transporter [Longitalea sp. SCSIO 12813]